MKNAQRLPRRFLGTIYGSLRTHDVTREEETLVTFGIVFVIVLVFGEGLEDQICLF